jgi:hypothetical protein
MRGCMRFKMYKKDYSCEEENIHNMLNEEYYNIKWFLFADKICLSNKSLRYQIRRCLYKNNTIAFSNNNIPSI